MLIQILRYNATILNMSSLKTCKNYETANLDGFREKVMKYDQFVALVSNGEVNGWVRLETECYKFEHFSSHTTCKVKVMY